MKLRINYAKSAPGVYEAMGALETYLETVAVDQKLLHLLKFRVSQINHCAYCLDMHSKDLRALGETEQRLYSLEAWQECPYYSDAERAALAWAESVTLVSVDQVPDAVYEEARKHFSEKDLADITLCLVAINGWNRLSIAARVPPGSYRSSLKPAT
ncbi:MAG TPA: carboxymuconolactone decarboxylase family protein [Gemmatimonadales bacterium]|nr:carboxymuconolactone decarboxylase family protein [Gemmatimonadales bacterium]